MKLAIRPLLQDDDATTFSCGHPALDLWLREHAWASLRRRTAATQALIDTSAGDVDSGSSILGYYSLAATAITTNGLPRNLSRGQPAVLPAFLLARLALDVSLHGQGIGSALLSHAVRSADRASQLVGARLLTVDAIDDQAAIFYQQRGFLPLTDNPRRLAAVIKHLIP